MLLEVPSSPGTAPPIAPTPEVELMQIGLVRSALIPEERLLCRQANVCLYCGGTGHFLRNCPIRLSKSSLCIPVYFQVSRSSLSHRILPVLLQVAEEEGSLASGNN